MKIRSLFLFCLGLLIATAPMVAVGQYLLYRHHMTHLYVPATEALLHETVWRQKSSPTEAAAMLRALQQDNEAEKILGGGRGDSQKHLFLMRFVMNRFSKVGSSGEQHPYALFLASERENFQGTLCGNMAELLAEFATIAGSKARVIQLQAGFGDRYDSHVAVELWEDGYWVLYDPTFNLTFRDANNTLLNSLTLRTLSRQRAEIQYEFHGEVAYPPRLQKYYLDYPSLLHVVSVATIPMSSFHKLPPFRYFWGPRNLLIAAPADMERVMDATLWFNSMYWLFIVFLPLLCFIEAGLCLFFWFRGRSLAQRRLS